MEKSDIVSHLKDVIDGTDFKNLGVKKSGKVRDVYTQRDRIIMVSTDRYSAFDRNLALIPFKGQVLTGVSQFWFEKTKDIVPNHVIDFPDPNAVIAKKCSVVPVEVVVRGYLTGVTGTSIWTLYQKGERVFGGLTLPEGMKKNEKLPRAILTPTTKMDTHDEPLTRERIISEKIVPRDLWEEIEGVALKLFMRGEIVALEKGLILVDTKYEFGVTPEGELMLIDEVHTPDSSRYWQEASYEERISKGEEPENFDKEFLRLWFKANCDPYKDEVLPEAPEEMIVELSSRYIRIYEQLTGETFSAETSLPSKVRIERNLETYQI